MGIFFALVALFGWGIGDFLMQRSSRSVGVWESMLFTGLIGCAIYTPFVLGGLMHLSAANVSFLALFGIEVVVTALFTLLAFRLGKVAVIVPILGLELPITIALSLFFAGEKVTNLQLLLMGMVFVGILLTVITRVETKHKIEQGVIFGLLAATCVGLTNFLVGIGSQSISPEITLWTARFALIIASAIYLLRYKKFLTAFTLGKKHAPLLLSQGLIDTAAWLGFAFATTLIPISIATTISENYILIAVILGVCINKEKLHAHQYLGIIVAVAAVIMLAAISS